MNTYGLHSINVNTFNLSWNSSLYYPQKARNVVVTVFRIHNLTLNILGNLSTTRFYSGCTRIAIGVSICAVTLVRGDRHAQQGAIIGRWYDEALLTGMAQIVRGILEAFIPNGQLVNASFDVIATVFNLGSEVTTECACPRCFAQQGGPVGPYPEPQYPLPFWPLYLA